MYHWWWRCWFSCRYKNCKKAKNKNIVVLESGGKSPGEAQAANEGEIVGNKAYDLVASRFRALGGTQWVWGGNSRPLDPIDFRERDWIADSGWPITYSEYSKYIKSATMELDIDDFDWSYKHPNLDYIKIQHKNLFEHSHFKLSPQIVSNSVRATGNYYQSKRKVIESLTNLHIIINATVVNFKTNKKRNIFTSLKIQNLKNQQTDIKASQFIFAAGAIENARLLKYFCQLEHGPTLKCQDNIGRYFMEHPHKHVNTIVTLGNTPTKFTDYFGKSIGSSVHQSRLRLLDSIQIREKLNNMTFAFMHYLHLSSKKFFNNIFNYDQLLVVVILMEQVPSRSNRIEFTNENDIFGIPKIKLHWNLVEQDWKSINSAGDYLSKFSGINGVGRSKAIKFNKDTIIGGGHHHMGTTRMGISPKNAVVDRNCKVFGLENVYMAGGSVFPTSGAVNPTLNMLALVHKLVDYLVQND